MLEQVEIDLSLRQRRVDLVAVGKAHRLDGDALCPGLAHEDRPVVLSCLGGGDGDLGTVVVAEQSRRAEEGEYRTDQQCDSDRAAGEERLRSRLGLGGNTPIGRVARNCRIARSRVLVLGHVMIIGDRGRYAGQIPHTTRIACSGLFLSVNQRGVLACRCSARVEAPMLGHHTAGLDARRLPGIFGKLGGYGGSPSPSPASRATISSSGSIPTEAADIWCPRISPSRQQTGNRCDGELGGSTSTSSSHVTGVETRGRAAPHGVGAGHAAVAGVLVVVDEHAVATLPPSTTTW